MQTLWKDLQFAARMLRKKFRIRVCGVCCYWPLPPTRWFSA